MITLDEPETDIVVKVQKPLLQWDYEEITYYYMNQIVVDGIRSQSTSYRWGGPMFTVKSELYVDDEGNTHSDDTGMRMHWRVDPVSDKHWFDTDHIVVIGTECSLCKELITE